jgi:hypothetical protein
VEPNIFYLVFDESGAGIDALLIHNSPLTVTTRCEIANFVATFIVLVRYQPLDVRLSSE